MSINHPYCKDCIGIEGIVWQECPKCSSYFCTQCGKIDDDNEIDPRVFQDKERIEKYNPFTVQRLFHIIEEEIEQYEATLEEEGVTPAYIPVHLRNALSKLKQHLLGTDLDATKVKTTNLSKNQLCMDLIFKSLGTFKDNGFEASYNIDKNHHMIKVKRSDIND